MQAPSLEDLDKNPLRHAVWVGAQALLKIYQAEGNELKAMEMEMMLKHIDLIPDTPANLIFGFSKS